MQMKKKMMIAAVSLAMSFILLCGTSFAWVVVSKEANIDNIEVKMEAIKNVEIAAGYYSGNTLMVPDEVNTGDSAKSPKTFGGVIDYSDPVELEALGVFENGKVYGAAPDATTQRIGALGEATASATDLGTDLGYVYVIWKHNDKKCGCTYNVFVRTNNAGDMRMTYSTYESVPVYDQGTYDYYTKLYKLDSGKYVEVTAFNENVSGYYRIHEYTEVTGVTEENFANKGQLYTKDTDGTPNYTPASSFVSDTTYYKAVSDYSKLMGTVVNSDTFDAATTLYVKGTDGYTAATGFASGTNYYAKPLVKYVEKTGITSQNALDAANEIDTVYYCTTADKMSTLAKATSFTSGTKYYTAESVSSVVGVSIQVDDVGSTCGVEAVTNDTTKVIPKALSGADVTAIDSNATSGYQWAATANTIYLVRITVCLDGEKVVAASMTGLDWISGFMDSVKFTNSEIATQ